MIEADTKRIGKHKPYGEFGQLLDALACARDVRGPYNVARRLKDIGGYEVSGQAVSNYLFYLAAGTPKPSTTSPCGTSLRCRQGRGGTCP